LSVAAQFTSSLRRIRSSKQASRRR
jgi:hypothetical protein